MSEQNSKEDLNDQQENQEELVEEAGDVEASQAEAAESEEQEPQLSVEELQAQADKYKEAFLRAKADEENVRRRSEKEIANSRKFAVEGFAKELLSVADSLKLASSSQIEDEAVKEAVKPIQEGVEITLKQLETALDKFAVKQIEANPGDKPDPNLHQGNKLLVEILLLNLINILVKFLLEELQNG